MNKCQFDQLLFVRDSDGGSIICICGHPASVHEAIEYDLLIPCTFCDCIMFEFKGDE